MFAARLSLRIGTLIALMSAPLNSQAAARPLDEVLASKTLRVIAYLDNAPFSFDDNGTPKGIDVDIAMGVARELGVKPEIVLRMQGEESDDDLRANIWRGPLTGGGVGDLMMHVPVDKEFAARNPEAVIGSPYFQERIAVAIHPELTGDNPTFDVFKRLKIGVKLATVSDYFLMRYQDGALVENVSHHVRDEAGIESFVKKETAALMGVRSNIEASLYRRGIRSRLVEPDMDGIVRKSWVVGIAWRDNSRDLGYAVAAAIEKMHTNGVLEKIFSSYGVTYAPPPVE